MTDRDPTFVHVTDAPPLVAPRFAPTDLPTLRAVLADARLRGRQRGVRLSLIRFRHGQTQRLDPDDTLAVPGMSPERHDAPGEAG
jgi:hypothetical protein